MEKGDIKSDVDGEESRVNLKFSTPNKSASEEMSEFRLATLAGEHFGWRSDLTNERIAESFDIQEAARNGYIDLDKKQITEKGIANLKEKDKEATNARLAGRADNLARITEKKLAQKKERKARRKQPGMSEAENADRGPKGRIQITMNKHGFRGGWTFKVDDVSGKEEGGESNYKLTLYSNQSGKKVFGEADQVFVGDIDEIIEDLEKFLESALI